ncbi:aad3b2fa-d330-45b3-9d58-17ef114a1167 [Sclerotinia trifoliorum]|uniref:Aad3b2fa-d330-45b3-9d58-17ef114a1167 n=1 Tax=Sclerotinia trifoliorum TaxID=28548 RepID=A0A8H2ZKP4_9HELO|nr:aad3b2fa-d330-45b3-9d58-17ef114a1167 [Sclerotinia trifoliorum]
MADASIEASHKRKFDDEIDVSSDLLAAAAPGPAATDVKKPNLVEDVNTQVLVGSITAGEGDSDEGGTITNQNYCQPAVSDAEESDIGMSEISEIMFDDEDEDDELEEEHSYGDEDDYEDSDSEPREYAVEEREITVQKDGTDQVVKLRLFMTKEEEFENWLQMIHVACTVDGQRIGCAFGRYIRREEIREHFWSEMEAPCSDMSSIAFELFDRYGYLNDHLKNHYVQKGTGVWGSELDFGPLFLIEHIEITDREWRRKGLGRIIVTAMIEKAQEQQKPQIPSPTEIPAEKVLDEIFADMFWHGKNRERYTKLHTISLPGWLHHDVKPLWEGKSELEQRDINYQAVYAAVSFHRSLGFRRIGASSCFGLSSDPDHKSHSLAIKDDYDPPDPAPGPVEEPTEVIVTMPGKEEDFRASAYGRALEETRLNKLKERPTPLNFAAVTLPDMELVEFYKAYQAEDKKEWKQADRRNNTLLHITACQSKPQSVKWLMENANDEQCLTLARNLKGYTPLEALQDDLNILRTRRKHGMMTIVIADKFSGFTPDAILCQFILLTGLMPVDYSDIPLCLRLKYGCTCGECVGGFLSPRMKLALLFQAEREYEIMDDALEMSSRSNSPTDWLYLAEDVIEHVTPALQRDFRTNKSLRRGFVNIFDHIATCLKANEAPTRQNVLQAWEKSGEWPPVTRNYLQWGDTVENKVEAVLEKIFEGAHSQNEAFGDGEFILCMEEEVEKSKTCRNDHEYGFVAKLCGLPERNNNPAGRLEGMFGRIFSGM